MKKLIALLLACQLLLSTCGQAGPEITTEEETTSIPFEKSIRINSSPMTHDPDTLSFAWTAPRVSEARTADYIAAQAAEIFEMLGVEAGDGFVVTRDEWQQTQSEILQCYDVVSAGKWQGVSLLCYIRPLPATSRLQREKCHLPRLTQILAVTIPWLPLGGAVTSGD